MGASSSGAQQAPKAEHGCSDTESDDTDASRTGTVEASSSAQQEPETRGSDTEEGSDTEGSDIDGAVGDEICSDLGSEIEEADSEVAGASLGLGSAEVSHPARDSEMSEVVGVGQSACGSSTRPVCAGSRVAESPSACCIEGIGGASAWMFDRICRSSQEDDDEVLEVECFPEGSDTEKGSDTESSDINGAVGDELCTGSEVEEADGKAFGASRGRRSAEVSSPACYAEMSDVEGDVRQAACGSSTRHTLLRCDGYAQAVAATGSRACATCGATNTAVEAGRHPLQRVRAQRGKEAVARAFCRGAAEVEKSEVEQSEVEVEVGVSQGSDEEDGSGGFACEKGRCEAN